jgi:Tannase and feruloyl esterase
MIPAVAQLAQLFAAMAASLPVAPGATPCNALTTVPIYGGELLSSFVVDAHDGLPAYCQVRGIAVPAISFELRLPLENWNGKLYMAGCSGFCGRLYSDLPNFTNAMNHGLQRGYAAATMDSGHWGGTVTDGRWALNDRIAETDWAFRSATETARVAKLVLQAHYGRPQSRAYFAGCSNGGRMALMEAQRFPADFDGIIAGAPALDLAGLAATHFAWVVQANRRDDGSEILARDKVAAIATAVVDACDATDGTIDRLIDDPRRCSWQPASLACSAKGNGPDSAAEASEERDSRSDPASFCLQDDEIAVLEKWYGGARDSQGRALYTGGVPLGSEPYWPLLLMGVPGARDPSLLSLFAQDFLRYMAFAHDPGEDYDTADYDFDHDPPRLAHMAALYDAEQANLAEFQRRGGKLIIYHGWADPLVTPFRTVEYFESLQGANGGARATAEFARLFMLPGFGHCGLQDGPGANDAGFDPLPALEAWVEQGIAPDSIPAQRRDTAGAVRWSRPVCAYPQVAQLRPGGNPHRAEDFECRVPEG